MFIVVELFIDAQNTKNKLQNSIRYTPEGSDTKVKRLSVGTAGAITEIHGASLIKTILTRRPVASEREGPRPFSATSITISK